MNPAIVYGGFLVGSFVYHRLTDERRPLAQASEIQIPLTAEGSAIPMYFGRVRIRQPILAACGEFETYPSIDSISGWSFNVTNLDATSYPLVYGLDMLFVLGIPFEDGVNRMHGLWAGETEMDAGTLSGKTIEDATGDGGLEQPSAFDTPFPQNESLACGFGLVEFLNGNSTQQLVNSLGTAPLTFAADRLTTLGQGSTDPEKFAGLRGYTSAFLFGGAPYQAFDPSAGIGDVVERGPPLATKYLRWIVGVTPQAPTYSFETSSYPNTPLHSRTVGDEANPADVAYAILKDHMGKLGLSTARVDYETFRQCAETLHNEGHGYSRAFEGLVRAEDVLLEIATQTDCTFYEDPLDGEIKMKLIRADYDPTELPLIDPSNCERLENFAAGGWTGIANKIRVIFENRETGYQPDSITAANQANAVGQDGETREVVLQMPGVKTDTLALAIASRELAARSRPIARFTAIVDRSFWRLVPGDPVMVSWPEYQVSDRVFRVAAVSREAADSNRIAIELIEDFFHVHRFEVSDGTGLPSFPREAAF